MTFLPALIIIIVLELTAFGATQLPGTAFLFTVILPYAAFGVFIGGVVYRLIDWGGSPVPFRIPTTCGQEKSLPWIKISRLESPAGAGGVWGRMALEALAFRSLFRNTKQEMYEGRPVYGSAKWLWFFGLMFHWSLLIIVLRHMRFFIEPIAPAVSGIAAVDGFFEIGVPTLYMTDIFVLAALIFLLLRRLAAPQLRYISLAADYLPLLLIMAIATTGVLMKTFSPVDLEDIKTLAAGWTTFAFAVPKSAGPVFYMHLFSVCALLFWLPFSKLSHLGGVFLSPTRNLANNSRMRRHINPWNAPVKVHTYEEYEDEFRDKMKAVGLPVEKE
jgi:nitrate reductase gamma subunit